MHEVYCGREETKLSRHIRRTVTSDNIVTCMSSGCPRQRMQDLSFVPHSSLYVDGYLESILILILIFVLMIILKLGFYPKLLMHRPNSIHAVHSPSMIHVHLYLVIFF